MLGVAELDELTARPVVLWLSRFRIRVNQHSVVFGVADCCSRGKHNRVAARAVV
jgi:hypothetical protein